MTTPLSEIPESEASAATAAIYADIRLTQSMPLVNLIWRHLATRDGALEVTWHAVRPLYESGAVQRLAAELLERVPRLPHVTISDSSATAQRLAAPEVVSIQQLLTTYNHGNSLNLVALSALIQHLRGTDTESARSAGNVWAAGEVPSVPPKPLQSVFQSVSLPQLADLGDDTVERILALNRFGLQGRDSPIVATLYRHLGHWPRYLELIHAQLAPLEANGTLDSAIDECRRSAFASTASVVKLMPRIGTISDGAAGDYSLADESLRAQVLDVAELFVSDAIARMVVIGTTLLSQLPGAAKDDFG